MLNSPGCRIALLLVAAALIGGLGFAFGFGARSVMVAMEPEAECTPCPDVAVVPAPTAALGSEEPTAELPRPTAKPINQETFDLFWEAWDIVQGEYYGEVPDEEEMTYGAIRGMVDSLGDPYTAFIDPQRAAIIREDSSGSFEGIGANVTMRDGLLTIVSVFEGQPADKAGLRSDDIVIKVDDTSLENMSVYEAISLIRGPAGTTVRLTVVRDMEEQFDVEITRARMEIPVLDVEMRADGIAYVALFSFDQDASVRLAAALEELLAQEPKGLILDLRDNPGGYLHEAIQTASLFLREGDLVLIERFRDGGEQEYTALGGAVAGDIPMVVLVNPGSASASEIVAGALQDHGRALLIGETTFGKGSVQAIHEMSNGAELRVTMARWFTPNDRAIHGEGLEPDIVVELTAEDVEAEHDPQLDRAVDYLLTGK